MAPPLHARRPSARPPLALLHLAGMQSTSQESVTTVLLSNLHCSRYVPLPHKPILLALTVHVFLVVCALYRMRYLVSLHHQSP